MRMQTQAQVKASSTPKPSFTSVHTGLLQRKCACGGNPGVDGECEECRNKRLSLQRRAANQAPTSTVPSSVHEVLRSSGQPLDAATRAFMEPRFGYDFSHVRVHTDARSMESARAVNALAYTVGHNVVFGASQYEPETLQGRRLLAHELTHVVQQNRIGGLSIANTLEVSTPGDPGEHEANVAASYIVGEAHLLDSPPPLVRSQGIALTLQRSMGDDRCGGAVSCASPDTCTTPDVVGSGGTASSWTLIFNIDTEEASFEDALRQEHFGHAYVKFTDNTGQQFTFGFYPQSQLPNENRPEVPGCVHHPDTTHEQCVDDRLMYSLSQTQYNAGLALAQRLCHDRPAYNAQYFNCTTFAGRVVQAAGQSLPPMRGTATVFFQTFTADNPNTLEENIGAERERDPSKRGPYWNNPCLNQCETSFNACLIVGSIGGITPMQCIAQRNRCINGCPRPR